MSEYKRWGILFRSENIHDGKSEYLYHEHGGPLAFTTRASARAWAENHCDYIRKRKDLQGEPHGWKPAKVVRVTVKVTYHG